MTANYYFSPFQGMWRATNSKGELAVFYSQEEAIKFSGVEIETVLTF